VSRVYLDPGVLLARPDAAEVAHPALASDAADALKTLADTGHELVLLASQQVHLPDGFRDIPVAARIDEGPATAWYLTSDPELCGRRQPGLRTVLVGPGPATARTASHRTAIQRCDIQTRDLHAAVIEILSREAMAPVG
jgi:hypothetical protein